MKHLDISEAPVLFLQPKEYFQKLGVNFETLSFNFEFGVSTNLGLDQIRGRYCAVVSCIDHSHFSRYVSKLARDSGISSILMMDGVFEWFNATNNPFLKKVGIKLLSPLVYSSVLVRDKGLFQYLNKRDVECAMYSSLGSDGERKLYSSREPALERKGSDFLITTANTPYFNENEFYQLVELIKKLVKVLDSNGYTYKYRLFDASLVTALGVLNVDNITEPSFDESLNMFSGVLTTPSTIVLNAMKAGLPVCIFDYRDGPLFIQAGWRMNSSSGILSIIESMLEKDRDRMGYQHDVSASESANSSLEAMINKGYLSHKRASYDFSKEPFVISFEYRVRCFFVLMRKKFSKISKAALMLYKK